MLAVAYKLQPNPVIRIGLAVAEVAVGTVELGRRSVKHGVMRWGRAVLVRSVFAIAEVARIAVTANAVTRLFMTTSSLGKCLPAPRTLHILV
jgi:hypothetical protein